MLRFFFNGGLDLKHWWFIEVKSKVVPTPEQRFGVTSNLLPWSTEFHTKLGVNVSGAGSHYSHAFPTKKEEYT